MTRVKRLGKLLLPAGLHHSAKMLTKKKVYLINNKYLQKKLWVQDGKYKSSPIQNVDKLDKESVTSEMKLEAGVDSELIVSLTLTSSQSGFLATILSRIFLKSLFDLSPVCFRLLIPIQDDSPSLFPPSLVHISLPRSSRTFLSLETWQLAARGFLPPLSWEVCLDNSFPLSLRFKCEFKIFHFCLMYIWPLYTFSKI